MIALECKIQEQKEKKKKRELGRVLWVLMHERENRGESERDRGC